jgi:hypothetical protein
MATQTAAPPSTARTSRSRLGVLFVVLAVTSALALLLMALWPAVPADRFYSYAGIAPIRDRFWLVSTLLAIGLVINVPAQALAAMAVARVRGAATATAGALLMVVGAAMQAAGIAGWAMLYWFTTGPDLDPAVAAPFLDRLGDDTSLFRVAMPGALLVVLGTVVQAVALWRSRAVPRWVPLTSLLIVPTFVLPSGGLTGALAQLPLSVAATAIGWYAWRRP